MPTFNTTDPKPGYVYDAATDTWFPLLGIAPASEVNRWTKTAAGAETSLSGNDDNAVSLSYTAGTEQVYLNGVLLVRGQDYTASNGTTITGLTALAASDIAEVITFNPSNIITTDAVLSTDFDAKGDLISASAASTPIRVPVGTNGYVLKANSATTSGLEWSAADDADAIQNSIMDAAGDIIYASAADTPARLALGTAGKVLKVNSGATAPEWAVDPTTDIVTTAGDLIYGTGADAVARLGIGTAGQVLQVNSGATAPEWATPSAGGMTLISTTTLTGASVTLSSIPQTYNSLRLVCREFKPATDSQQGRMYINNDSGANRYRNVQAFTSNTTFNNTFIDPVFSANDNSVATGLSIIDIPDYTNATTWKMVEIKSLGVDGTTTANQTFSINFGLYNQTTAITSLVFFPSSGNFTSGTLLLYGVK